MVTQPENLRCDVQPRIVQYRGLMRREHVWITSREPQNQNLSNKEAIKRMKIKERERGTA